MSNGQQQILTARGLERRLKRHVLKAKHAFFASCALGFEPWLEQEIKNLPELDGITKIQGGVSFQGPLDTMYHANLQLRTAHRVLLRIEHFLAQSYPMLFDHAKRIPWEHFIGFNNSYRFDISAKTSRLRHHKNIAKTLQDAIQYRLEPLGLSPHLSDDAPLSFFIRFHQDRCTVSLNTSGEHLHKRGYRQHVGDAPIRETLAAGVLMALDWQTYDLVFDPMCGSGTFLLEAAQMNRDKAAGERRAFAFESAPFFQESKWLRFKQEAGSSAVQHSQVLLGSDIDQKVVEAAKYNAEVAHVEHDIGFQVQDALTFDYKSLKKTADRPLVVSNLPYGERIGNPKEVKRRYQKLVTQLCAVEGLSLAFVTSQPDWLLHSELDIKPLLQFPNGGIKTSLLIART